MRFLQRQRKSIRSGEFFKCHLCLLLIAAMLVAAALPNGVRESGPLDSVKRMGQTGGQEFCPDRKQTGTMVAAPNEERPEVEAAGRKLSEAHVIETLRQKSAYRLPECPAASAPGVASGMWSGGTFGRAVSFGGERARAAVGTDSLGKKDCSIHKEGRRKKERPCILHKIAIIIL